MRKESSRTLERGKRDTRKVTLLAAGALLACLPAALLAQDDAAGSGAITPAREPVQELLELDEVMVQAYSLHERIVRAEDRFFQLYNELNPHDDYRVNCAYLPLEPGSRIDGRVCMPAFHANAIALAAVMPRCLVERAPSYHWSSRPLDDVPPSSFCYTSPPPELVLLERSNAYARNLRDVIRTDARLQVMAGELDELYRQGTRVMNRYHEINTNADQRASTPRFRPKIR